ncbi:MAG TPA: putative baseplate assembly protein [Gemmatimonadaceae bacterium]|nr:putative baseplate assembly protein [Gemmatimonadaceae bacterium]
MNGAIVCSDDARLDVLLDTPSANGIADVEVVPHAFGTPLFERELTVFFYRAVPPSLIGNVAAFSFTGGERIPGPTIAVQTAVAGGGGLRLTLTQGGDFSDYTLLIADASLDPRFDSYTFNFKVDCPRLADCRPPCPPATPLPADPNIDYLTKDYDSFLQALTNFLPTRVASFNESSEADLAITLAELFSYAGDQLSYYQDAVSNEAWLATCRQRLSAKRHARLVDYRMYDGLAARAILCFDVVIPTTIPRGLAIATNDPDPNQRVVFETDESFVCRPELGAIEPWPWLGTDCCLTVGATQVDLAGDLTALQPGDLLLAEEVLGPVPAPDGTVTWLPQAANPDHRQIVRVLSATLMSDPLPPGGAQLTRVTWQAVDALAWAVTIVADGQIVTMFRGNLVRASNGETVAAENVNLQTLTLANAPLTLLDNGGQSAPPWTWLFPPDQLDPRRAVSSIQLTANGDAWTEVESLLSSQPTDRDFVVDTDDQGHGVLRFGDGQLGQALPPNAALVANYRIGIGTSGNVGRDTLIRPRTSFPGGALAVRNPLPAYGGVDPEPIENVRRDAPQAFQAVQYRAVTAQDYAEAAKLVPGVSNAAAEFRWTGSWLTVFVGIDPVGRADLPAALLAAVRKQLTEYRQAGYDLDIRPPDYVPLRIELTICVSPDWFQANVLAEVNDALTAGLTAAGTPGFFNPDSFTFGQSLYLSALYAAVQNLPGVTAVHATVFRPLLRAANGELEDGEITCGAFQVLRLDNDPSRPENGALKLTPESGL